MNFKIKPIVKEASDVNISLSILDGRAYANVVLKSDCIMKSYSLTIEGEEYDAWGSDDSYIYDLILSKLGFEKA
mgnify:FL=1